MYKEGSKLWFVNQIISSMYIGGTASVMFEDGVSTCYIMTYPDETGEKKEIPEWYAMGCQMMRNYITKVSNDTGAIVNTKLSSEESKFLHLRRIK